MTLPLCAAATTAATAATTSASTWPFVILVVCVAFVIVTISVFKLHPFLALIFAAALAGIMAERLPVTPGVASSPWKTYVTDGKLAHALKLTTTGFGETAGTISIVIGMATVIGMALMESGAADKVVRRFLAIMGTGPKGISFAIVISTYILSIPIFFDSMFMLMIPIAMAMALRTGRDFTLYVLAICAGGTITHSLTVPHPGPLFMVDNLKIDIGLSLWVGLVVGLIPVVFSWIAIQYLNRFTPVELRETPATPLHSVRAAMAKPESELPSLFMSLLPIVLPILLISTTSVFKMLEAEYKAGHGKASENFAYLKGIVDFIGDKSMALAIGAVLSLWVLARQRKPGSQKISDLIGPPLETAGILILITAAGGAFGYMLNAAGVGDALAGWAREHTGVNLILLAYVVALIFRIAQGSATVAMQATSAMVAGIIANASLPYHKVYIFCAVGFGAIAASWMNDSGFWVVSRLSGFTERQTLRTWTVLLSIISVVGIIFTYLLSIVLPFAG